MGLLQQKPKISRGAFLAETLQESLPTDCANEVLDFIGIESLLSLKKENKSFSSYSFKFFSIVLVTHFLLVASTIFFPMNSPATFHAFLLAASFSSPVMFALGFATRTMPGDFLHRGSFLYRWCFFPVLGSFCWLVTGMPAALQTVMLFDIALHVGLVNSMRHRRISRSLVVDGNRGLIAMFEHTTRLQREEKLTVQQRNILFLDKDRVSTIKRLRRLSYRNGFILEFKIARTRVYKWRAMLGLEEIRYVYTHFTHALFEDLVDSLQSSESHRHLLSHPSLPKKVCEHPRERDASESDIHEVRQRQALSRVRCLIEIGEDTYRVRAHNS